MIFYFSSVVFHFALFLFRATAVGWKKNEWNLLCNPFEIFKFNPESRRGFSKRHKQPSTQHIFNMSAHLVVNISQTFFCLYFILRGAFYGIKIYFSFWVPHILCRACFENVHPFPRKVCVWYDVVHCACKYVLKNHSQVEWWSIKNNNNVFPFRLHPKKNWINIPEATAKTMCGFESHWL